jgi:protein-L-isoaspartate(D-aspartate) O-methyltransferase
VTVLLETFDRGMLLIGFAGGLRRSEVAGLDTGRDQAEDGHKRTAALPAPTLPTSFSEAELSIVRRAYARQMLAIVGVENPAIEAAFAAVSREAFLGPPPWAASSPFSGYRPLSSGDPAALYQDIVVGLDPARGVNNGSPSLHALLLEALGPKPGDHIVHVGAGAGYYSAILAELVGPSGRVTAIEFNAALAARAKQCLSNHPNVEVVCDDGARWPQGLANGVYVNFAAARPADRWIEGLAPGGRLVFPLGVPGPRRPNSQGRHSDRGAALRVERRSAGFAARAVSPAYFVCAEGAFDADPAHLARLRAAFDAGGLDTIRSLVWKRPAPSHAWFAAADWALGRDDPL